MPTKTRSQVSQLDEAAYEQAPDAGEATYYALAAQTEAMNGYAGGQEVVDEVKGVGDGKEATDETFYDRTESAEEAAEAISNPHASMSSPPLSTAAKSSEAEQESAQEADTESAFETVEGWEESQLQEAGEEQEPVVEAYYAEAGSEEFFPALGALVAPLMKVVVPQIAGALLQQGAKALSPKLRGLLGRLHKIGLKVTPAQAKAMAGMFGQRVEAYGQEEGAEVDEAALEALEQQIEALEVVIGKDDRVRVMNTKIVPWKRICHLKITAANGKSFLGSGAFIGPRTILTAGHCVYLHSQGGWAREIVVTPGRNGDEAPFKKYMAQSLRSVRGWVVGKTRNYDYGAILLSRNANISPEIGAFGFSALADNMLRNARLNTAGYPGDKPAGTMWFHGRRAKAVLPQSLLYDIDTAGGQSGSPVWIRQGRVGSRLIVGIHTNGATSGNSATRITHEVFTNLKTWRAQGGGAAAVSARAGTGAGARAGTGAGPGAGAGTMAEA